MEALSDPGVTTVAVIGFVTGLILLARGMNGYRSVIRLADTSTSTIASLAAGEVRVNGVVEPSELTLVSPLLSVPCVYYRASVGSDGDGRPEDVEERSIGFRVRDATGTLRVFPRGARFDVPARFEGETDLRGDPPAGLNVRTGASTRAAEVDDAVAAAALLAVAPTMSGQGSSREGRSGGRRYRETRLEPGDPVTIVGRALPFSDLDDPVAADRSDGSDGPTDDPEIAADLAEARGAGRLAGDPAAAWGNAAIPGFGIGRPVHVPSIDVEADRLPLGDADAAARAERTFRIAPKRSSSLRRAWSRC